MIEITPTFSNVNEMIEKRGEDPQLKDKEFFYFYEEVYTFGQIHQLSNKLANGLLKLGIKKGDIVHIYMNNSPQNLIANIAVNKIGAITGPVNCWWQTSEIRYMFNDSQAKAIIFDSCYETTVSTLKTDCLDLKIFIEFGDKIKEGHISFNKLIEENNINLQPVAINEQDIAYIFYTSGTTGNPKGALITHEGIMYCIEGIRKFLETTEATGDEVALIFLPMFHVNGMMSMLSIIYRAIKVTLRTTFSANEFGEVVQRYKPSFFSAVPTIYNILLQIKDMLKQFDLSSLKYGICGAAPMPVELFKRFEEEFGIEIIEGYGLTEGTVASTLNPREGVKKIGSIGQAIYGQEVKIVDEDGKNLPIGKVGEIIVRGKNVMKGYWKKPEETKNTLKDGWLHTGDMGYKDEDGYFFIVDRKKDMIIRGGENIYPKEIENVLFQHPKVLDAAVIGVKDEVMGEEVKAFVVKKNKDVTEDEIREHCLQNLAKFKVPRYIEFVSTLPKNIIGKTLKKELRQKEEGKKN